MESAHTSQSGQASTGPNGYEYKTKPFSHQGGILPTLLEHDAYGVLWEQGCGKTKPLIDETAIRFEAGEIDCLLVVGPRRVPRNWLSDEIPTHMPDRVLKKTLMHLYQAVKAGTKWHKQALERALKHEGLLVIAITYDAFMTKAGKNFIWRLLKQRKVLYALDEAHNIKTPKAKRTRSVVASGKYAKVRRILTGTPIGKGPFDIYSQVRFLDEQFWLRHRMGSFQAFKHYFGVWRTRADVLAEEGWDPGYDMLLDYKNLDYLNELLGQVSNRVTKDEVLDLPPKLYSKERFQMSKEQCRVYEQLKNEYYAELESGEFMEAPLAIVRLLRLQQIACGYAQADIEQPKEMLGGENRRLDTLVELCEPLGHQAIIWSRFTHDIDLIMDALGEDATRYDGKLDEDELDRSKDAFQAGEFQWLVGNPKVGGEGITLHAARTVFFYANNFSMLERKQAEDRPHRIGQRHPVNYVDLIAEDTVDEHIIDTLRRNHDVASQINGDVLKEWL